MNQQLEVVFDLETVPSQNPELLDSIRADLRENFKAPSDMTKERACAELGMTDPSEVKFTSKARALELWVDRFRDEKLEATALETLHKTCFDGALGQIAVIGFALDDAPAMVYQADSLDIAAEMRLISDFFTTLEEAYSPSSMRNPLFIGHNVAGFDLPFLFKRAVVLGIKPPAFIPFGAAPWADSVFDTMVRWDSRNNVSLDKLCKALGVPGKTEGMNGADVWPMIQAGRIGEVAAYCLDDVDAARNAFRRMTFRPLPVAPVVMQLEDEFAF
jgi:DNA polymerase elongation subunit (family B)